MRHHIPTMGSPPDHWRVERNRALFNVIDDRSPEGEEELLTVSHLTGVTPRSEKNVTMFMAESLKDYTRARHRAKSETQPRHKPPDPTQPHRPPPDENPPRPANPASQRPDPVSGSMCKTGSARRHPPDGMPGLVAVLRLSPCRHWWRTCLDGAGAHTGRTPGSGHEHGRALSTPTKRSLRPRDEEHVQMVETYGEDFADEQRLRRQRRRHSTSIVRQTRKAQAALR